MGGVWLVGGVVGGVWLVVGDTVDGVDNVVVLSGGTGAWVPRPSDPPNEQK